MENFFKLKENGTKCVPKPCRPDHFLAMAYIIVVNPHACIIRHALGRCIFSHHIASIIGTLVMGLVPMYRMHRHLEWDLMLLRIYRCFGLGFTWQEALAMVFLCGVINILITVTKSASLS